MRDLITYLKGEMDTFSGESKEKFKCWIDMINIMFPELEIITDKCPDNFRNKNRGYREGIIGIKPEFREASYSNRSFRSQWTVTYQADLIRVKRNYSITKYGNEQAFKMACVMRYILGGKLQVYSLKGLPCKIPVPYEMIK